MLTVTSGDVTEVAASPPTLIFSPGNWNSPQTVTVTGVDDKLLDGMQMTLVTLSVADALSDDHFDVLFDQAVTVTTSDDDIAGFRLSQVTALVSESGTTDTFTVVLTAQPDDERDVHGDQRRHGRSDGQPGGVDVLAGQLECRRRRSPSRA